MQRDLSKTWVITAPTSGAADQGLAGAAETQVGALSIVTMLDTPPAPSAIGLGNLQLIPWNLDLSMVQATKSKLGI